MFLVVHLVSLLLLTGADVQHLQENATEKQLGGGLACGSVLRGAEFLLKSPGYPLPPPRGLTCFYVIEAARPSICFIELTFLTFDLGDCGVSGDSLEVAGMVLCGGRTVGTRSFRFNPPRSLVVFRTGETAGGKGFEILVRQQQCPVPTPATQPDCSATYTTAQFYIHSPARRPTGRVCEYTIVGSNRPLALCQVELLFENMDLETTAGCTGERLEVGDQDVLCGTLTGTRVYRFVGLLRLRYISTKESIGSGFRILVMQKGCRQLTFSNSGSELPPSVPVPTPPPFQPSPPDLGPNLPHLPPIYPPVNPNIPHWSPLCCGIVYESHHFYIASPGFPYYDGNAMKECVYRIRPSGPDVCRVRIIFKFFWLGKEDSYIGCFNNGYLQLDGGQRICGCKTGAVVVSPFFQGQEKELYYKGYSGGGFLLELFQERCTNPGWFERSDAKVPETEGFYRLHPTKERLAFNISLKNATTSRTSSSVNMDTLNISSNNNTFPSEYSRDLGNEERSFESGVRSMNITVKQQMMQTDELNALRSSEGEEQHSNLRPIKNALDKNCKVSWKFFIYEDNDKQLLCSNRSNVPPNPFLPKNESYRMFVPSEQYFVSRHHSPIHKGAFVSLSEDGAYNLGNNSSVNTSLTNKSQDYKSLDTETYPQNVESRRNKRGIYNASSRGICYSWYRMVQDARRFIWVNGLPRTLCPGSRRCQLFAEAFGWVKLPGYPPVYPNNVNFCFG